MSKVSSAVERTYRLYRFAYGDGLTVSKLIFSGTLRMHERKTGPGKSARFTHHCLTFILYLGRLAGDKNIGTHPFENASSKVN